MAVKSDKSFNWFECSCCPYGYHIDLDFVRFCESIQRLERSDSFKRRKDRRRQRQSMEVLLGLISPVFQESTLLSIQDSPRSPIQKALSDVVSDFENTLQKSKSKLSHNLPDVTAVSGEGAGVKDFDSYSIDSIDKSSLSLLSIREQMALSLERTKGLEKTVKMIPILKEEIRQLELKNKELQERLQVQKEIDFNSIDLDFSSESKNSVNDLRKNDFGTAFALNNVMVGNVSQSKSLNVDRWLNEKCKFLNVPHCISQSGSPPQNKSTQNRETQTAGLIATRGVPVQTVGCSKLMKDEGMQFSFRTPSNEVGINTYAFVKESAIQATPKMASVAISADTIEEAKCSNCKLSMLSSLDNQSQFRTQTDTNANLEPAISLNTLSATPMRRSSNLGESKLDKIQLKAVSCQYKRILFLQKSSQTEVKTESKYCQKGVESENKSVQSEFVKLSQSTSTENLTKLLIHKSIDTKDLLDSVTRIEVACNTSDISDVYLCARCSNESYDSSKKGEPITTSRIPRLVASDECRVFKRQDTYSKFPNVDESALSLNELSALELITAKTEAPKLLQLEEIHRKYKKLADDSSEIKHQNETSEVMGADTAATTSSISAAKGESKFSNNVSESLGIKHSRKKYIPSKEMQAAMKVLNDSLHKNKLKSNPSQLINANAVVENEWFRISSVLNADPLHVEDYLDAFEDISSMLLEHIVNTVDSSGNTAMHYAISHGNFDVVSILLDSKVCDIDKQNKAGYTSVMLVSLAEISSATHADVVRRLFSLADVNIRAKQHGQTALMLAVSHGRLHMVTLLLEAGADINIQDEDGSTALMCAAEHGHFEIVKYFLSQRDCDPTICDVDGMDALNIAMEAGHRHIGVQLYAHERILRGNTSSYRPKMSKSTSGSPQGPLSPLMQRSVNRALPTNK